MTVKEYVKNMTASKVTFIKARARKDAATPFYHAEYQTTPMYFRDEVIKNEFLSNYIILNDKQAPITWLSGAVWNNEIKDGFARCLLVINPSDFELLFRSDLQREDLIKYIEKKLDI